MITQSRPWAIARYFFSVTAVLAVRVLSDALLHRDATLGRHDTLMIYIIPVAAAAVWLGVGPSIVAIVLALAVAEPWTLHSSGETTAFHMLYDFFGFLLVACGAIHVLYLLHRTEGQLRAALSSTTHRLAAIVEDTDEAVISEDLDGKVTSWNSAAEKLFGWPAQLMLGEQLERLFPDTPESIPANIAAHARTGQTTRFRSARAVTRDGRDIWISMSISPLRDDRGNVAGVSRISHDVTDLKTAQAALSNNRKQLQAIIDAGPITLIAFDTEGVITVYEGLQLFDVCPVASRPIGYSILDLWADQPAVIAACRQVLGGQSFRENIQIRGHWFDISASPVRDAEGNVTGGLAASVEITDRIQSQQLAGERNGLQQAVKSLEAVLGVVGHELRTPLAGIRGMSELLLHQELSSSEQSLTFIRSIHCETVRMADTINNLLEAARLNSGAARWNWSTFPLEGSCRAAVETMRQLVHPGVDLTLIAQPRVDMTGDADAIRRLVLNLLTNASRHTQAGYIRVRAAARREADGLWVDIVVEDSGAGIAPARLRQLGQAFSLNAGAVGDVHSAGAGLGLAICKGIAAAHGGRIGVHSESSRGTTVSVSLRADLQLPCPVEGHIDFATLAPLSQESRRASDETHCIDR